MADPTPLVLRADETLLRTRLSNEVLWAGLGQAPLRTLTSCVRHVGDLDAVQRDLAARLSLRADLIPSQSAVQSLLDAAHAAGRRVVLVSQAPETLLRAAAEAHGINEVVSRPTTNALAARLVALFGHGGFDFAGRGREDLPIWKEARRVYAVGASSAMVRRIAARGRDVTHLHSDHDRAALLRALRPHQWVKNILLALPMIAAHDFTLSTFLAVLLGMVAFSAAASSIYVVNDLLDLDADRLHATKCRRPFASGQVPLGTGMAVGLGLGIGALVLAGLLNGAFLAAVVVYMGLSLAYSLRLKRMRWVDIFCLATLYTLRVVAGAMAGQVDVSIFMLVFIFPVFVALGCVKRMTELALATDDRALPGRGYGRKDRSDLLNMAGIGMAGAVLVFASYALSDQGRTLYPTTWILFVAMTPLSAWLIRMIALGFHGKQDYDPIVFAMRDRLGVGLLLMTLSLMFWAAGLWSQWFGS